jgi:hypothetical protein
MSHPSKGFAEYQALEAERTDITYRSNTIDKIKREAYERGVIVGRQLERDYVLQFVVDHEFSKVCLSGRDVADELRFRTEGESRAQINKHLGK